MKSVCKELKRFDDATHKLAVENEETLHLVVPLLHELKAKMKKEAVKYGQQNPDMSQLCNDLARSLEDKCWSKLTWYHFAAAFLFPEYRDHASMIEMTAEVDRVRLDLRAMLSSMTAEQTQPMAKKPRTILYDSDHYDFYFYFKSFVLMILICDLKSF